MEQNKKKNFYDLDQVKSISILSVCEMFGVRVDRSQMCQLRDEKTPSCKLYTKGSDYDHFHDFGDGSHGDVIVFVSRLTGSDWQTSLETLAEAFGIEPVNNTDYKTRNELSDYEWAKLGVAGDLATKNLSIDLERFSIESAQKYSDKYHMTVNELRQQYPKLYQYQILQRRAIPEVMNLRNDYYFGLYNYYTLRKSVGIDSPVIGNSTLKEFETKARELTQSEKILRKALAGTNLEEKFTVNSYEVQEDFQKVIEGNVPIQVGNKSYNEIKFAAAQDGVTLLYRSVGEDTYFGMGLGDLLTTDEISHAAFLKSGCVNLAFLPKDNERVKACIDLLTGEKDVSLSDKISDAKVLAEDSREEVDKIPDNVRDPFVSL